MRLFIIRHGDPDYSVDSLTEKGWREARLLAGRIAPMEVCAYYVSPLGRARDTASLTLKQAGRTAVVLSWLREFDVLITDPATGKKRIPWDMLPADWTAVPAYYDKESWHGVPIMQAADMRSCIDVVQAGLDDLLAQHGYRREKGYYRAECPNEDTVVLFCHFGVTCVILGHLLGASPMVLWHGLIAAPTSVTSLVTEERREGIASFRMTAFGDTAHLSAAGEPIAFAGRFCERFTNTAERHD